MASIHLRNRWVDQGEMVHLCLLAELLEEYLSSRAGVTTKNVAFGVVPPDTDDDDPRNDWKTVNVLIPIFDEWRSFSKWCSQQCINVSVPKKSIDGNKDWWPVAININVPADNERFVLTKLKVM